MDGCGEGDVCGTGRMDCFVLVDDVFGGADPVWGFFGRLEDVLVNVSWVWSVGVVVGGGVLEEVVRNALTGEGKRGKRLVEEGSGGGGEGGFTFRPGRMMGGVVGVVVVQFVVGGVRVEDGGRIECGCACEVRLLKTG